MYETVKGMVQNDRDFYRDNLGSLLNPRRQKLLVLVPLVVRLRMTAASNPNIGFNNSTTDGFPGSVLVRDLSIASMAMAA